MTVETTTQTIETIANAVVGAAAAAGVPHAATAQAALSSAETVVNAVEAEAPHHTAVAAIGAGVTALASTPIVQTNAQAAAVTGIAASFFAWLKSEFAKL